MAVARLPRTPVNTVREAIFVAGPANKNTSAAPGLIPFRIRAAAIGVEAVAQIYNGIPTASMRSMAGRPDPKYLPNRSSGMSTVINPANKRPTKNQPARSPHRSEKANRNPPKSFSKNV